MKRQSVNILGNKWTIIFTTVDKEPRLKDADGFCDRTVKKIVIDEMKREGSDFTIEDITSYKNKVIRHEIVHAFLFESGLGECSYSPVAWALNEEMIDWIASMTPKMYEVWKQLGVEK